MSTPTTSKPRRRSSSECRPIPSTLSPPSGRSIVIVLDGAFRCRSTAGEAVGTDRPRCAVLSGHGAPGWAKADLNALYLGGIALDATAPPGFRAGGCSDGTVTPPRGHGEFAYSVGTSPDGAILSVAVDSLRFGPAISLAPAAQQVLALIEAGQMPIGGYPRVEAGGGDLVPVLTPRGTMVLVRASTHLPGKTRFATPYVKLGPSVAAAWAGAMNELDSWLWPVGPRTADGIGIFDLRRDSQAGKREFEIIFHRQSGVADRGPYAYRWPQPQLSQAELEERAAEAG